MISIYWTFVWTGLAGISFFVRLLVLRSNLQARRILRSPDGASATTMMRRIATGHMRVSLALAFISICNATVGAVALYENYHKVPMWFSLAVGYFFIGYFILSEIILTLLAWLDLRARNSA
jgi:hypothetical protein